MPFRVMLAVFLCISSPWCHGPQHESDKPGSGDIRSRIPGEWRGRSVCLDRTSPCHDETNVYRFSKSPKSPDGFVATASKVVGEKEIVMGSGEWRFDDDKNILESETPKIRLEVSGDQMEGMLTLPSGAAYRRIYLRKQF